MNFVLVKSRKDLGKIRTSLPDIGGRYVVPLDKDNKITSQPVGFDKWPHPLWVSNETRLQAQMINLATFGV